MSAGNTNDVMRDIAEKLDAILGFMIVKDLKGDASLIVPRLKALGMSVKTIALVAGISENAVNLRVSRMKKPRKAAGKSKTKPSAGAASPGVSADDSGAGNSNASEA